LLANFSITEDNKIMPYNKYNFTYTYIVYTGLGKLVTLFIVTDYKLQVTLKLCNQLQDTINAFMLCNYCNLI